MDSIQAKERRGVFTLPADAEERLATLERAKDYFMVFGCAHVWEGEWLHGVEGCGAAAERATGFEAVAARFKLTSADTFGR